MCQGYPDFAPWAISNSGRGDIVTGARNNGETDCESYPCVHENDELSAAVGNAWVSRVIGSILL